MTVARKERTIFGRTSTMSSHSMKTVQPSLRADEMAYLALSFCSSSVAPAVTSAWSTQRGSTAASSSTRKRPLLRLLSCRSRRLAVAPVDPTFSRAHLVGVGG